MKLFVCLILMNWVFSASALRCWSCENAKSPEECLASGAPKQCRLTEKVCQTEVRYNSGWGTNPIIRTDCKEPHACGNNYIQNPRRAWEPTQCNLGKKNSVCRCCCSDDDCNKIDLLCGKASEPICPVIDDLRHGNINCTGEGNELGTKCQFQCTEEGYELLPSDRNEAECIERNGQAVWNRRKPCCNARCPPVARKDIVILIDSSRSISNKQWIQMKDFVINVIKSFDVSAELVQFAVFRFNRRIDSESQVLFGDYDNVDELVELVKKIPKDGSGTRVGKALRHARDVVLKHQNRDNVGDMVWVLTDGRSKDEIHDVSGELRAAGVEIIALAISNKDDKAFLDQLTEITGDEDLVMDVDDFFETFSTSKLVERVTGKICEISCE